MISLILGGARSGKSRYGLKLANQASEQGKSCVFIATAQAFDDEMQQRINRHKEERRADGIAWQLIESPLDLSTSLETHATANNFVLVDCLTLWLTNHLMQQSDYAVIKAQLLNTLQQLPGDVVLVSNEVGMGVIPADPLSRQFVDQAGWLHQALAELADEVVLVTAGIAQVLKSAHQVHEQGRS
ncbi:bifunctional adenosylcobinamide kinase/adenosylcobinamide-phosphate guanylyltransferase [Shewanella sp. Scap07]|uniref:bifunctional adenosylcobinamide kinase/adenosylcobinamide-phosphate guanylyltransferase n=1 Tax=Shewanella sp. Scap07 TaxID=2589987 RepID=UPI0015BDAF14|nr:bifunctional adenosylcobinamide kinase/adenosylcobinamide-phosphate guanylyltransferase [Shewanella sp. Scap07]QLE86726.1 bifunctional adenosylcobinamide kinase/adenosylcobinamide-phosphate guanylyltransferase [Shewanella sp. Scap07]